MRWLRNLLLLLLLLLGLPLLLVEVLGDPIARRVVRSLNARFPTTIAVENYDLSLLRAFPHLSAELSGVTIMGSDGSRLLEAESLGCLLDLSSLWATPRIDAVRLRRGRLQLLTDVDGNTNYQLAGYTSVGDRQQEEVEGADAGAVLFRIDQAQLTDIIVVYRDDRLQTDALLRVNEAEFSGNFGSERYTLATDADVRVSYLDQAGSRYLTDRPFTVAGEIAIDQRRSSYTFSPLRTTSGELTLEATGEVTTRDEGLALHIVVSSSADRLEDVIQLLPPNYARHLYEMESRGDLELGATVIGDWTATDYPRLDGRLRFTDGRISHPRSDITGRGLDLAATFAFLDGPRGGVQTLSIDHLRGQLNGEDFEIAWRLEDLRDPRLTFRANGNFPLATLPALADNGSVTEGDGLLRIDELRLEGKYEDMLRPRRMGRVSSSGRVTFEGAELTINEHSLRFPAGTLTLGNNSLEVADLIIQLEQTDLLLNGRAENFIPVLFADSLNSQDAKLNFRGKLSGERLNIAEVLALSGPTDEELEIATTTSTRDSLVQAGNLRRARITDLLQGTFESRIDRWTWDEMRGDNFRGQFIFRPGQLKVAGETDAMEGHFRVDATSFFNFTNRIEARLSASGVDVREFFQQSDDFGQNFLTQDNLSGRMNARLLLHLNYDESGAVDYDELRALVGMEILDGELRDFALLEAFAFALKAGDLERVRFERLANYFEIRDRTVYLPAMFIQSSAVNLTLSAAHTFDQQLEYYLKLNAGQVLANKISRHDRQLEVLPARNGLFNLYYTIEGPLEDYTVETNRQAVKTQFRRSAYRRNRIEAELRDRFREPIVFQTTEVEEEDL
jgi:hypothetical protein